MRAILARRRRVETRFEEVVHGFAEIIATAVDSATVESAFLRLVREQVPASWIELVPEPPLAAGDPGAVDAESDKTDRRVSIQHGCAGTRGQSLLEVPLRCGKSLCGRLRIRSRTGGSLPVKNDVIQRLTTLCTMAACAIESIGRQAECGSDDDASQREALFPQSAAIAPRIGNAARRSVLFHDATFLNAVLPFALSQAKRHRESLSLLCVAIDRLSGIQDLLGTGEVDRLVQHVGQTISGLIRASDIVARLDDNRIVAVLPRAPRGGALHVAENICRAVAREHPEGCTSARITVSIGVATFPSCAANVYALFDAADEALSWAQKEGRDRAVLAPTLQPPIQAQAAARTP